MGRVTSLDKRCAWVTDEPLYIDYHDNEWGRACHDERYLFEMLILEGMQAGLSWWTVLKKRQHFRVCFDNFDHEKIALYNEKKINKLCVDAGLIRHRGKLKAVVNNAQCYLQMRKDGLSLDKVIWDLVDGRVLDQPWKNKNQVPATSEISDLLSKKLKKYGFKYVGSTICYAYLQAVGVINDHLADCICRSKR